MLDWVFRNRETGEITVAQFPNVAIWVFLGATGVRLLVHPAGTAADVVTWVGRGALLYWGADELLRGVNPWRRFLGAGALVWQAATILG